jgi:hypothetical protein
VTASGTSAQVPLTIPPGPATSPDRPTAAAPEPDDDTIWYPTIGMLLLLVVAALGISRFTSWSASRHTSTGHTPHEAPESEAIEVPETGAVDAEEPPLVPAATG